MALHRRQPAAGRRGQQLADPMVVDQKLNGAVDELLIYDRALTATEVSQLASGIQPRL